MVSFVICAPRSFCSMTTMIANDGIGIHRGVIFSIFAVPQGQRRIIYRVRRKSVSRLSHVQNCAKPRFQIVVFL